MFASWKPVRDWTGLLTLSLLAGCGQSTPVEPERQQMVYVDMATMKPLVHDVATSFPAVHPATGKPTLRPALYCSTCRQWYAAPPADQIQRVPGAGRCPKDKSPLTADGPWPLPEPGSTAPAK
jgi:uncharacterized protein YbaR (Trm112 family)